MAINLSHGMVALFQVSGEMRFRARNSSCFSALIATVASVYEFNIETRCVAGADLCIRNPAGTSTWVDACGMTSPYQFRQKRQVAVAPTLTSGASMEQAQCSDCPVRWLPANVDGLIPAGRNAASSRGAGGWAASRLCGAEQRSGRGRRALRAGLALFEPLYSWASLRVHPRTRAAQGSACAASTAAVKRSCPAPCASARADASRL